MPLSLNIRMPCRHSWMPALLHRKQHHFRWPRWARRWIIFNRKQYVVPFCMRSCRRLRYRPRLAPERCCRHNRHPKRCRRKIIRHRRRAARAAHAITRKDKCLLAKNAAKYSMLTTTWHDTCPSTPALVHLCAKSAAKVYWISHFIYLKLFFNPKFNQYSILS